MQSLFALKHRFKPACFKAVFAAAKLLLSAAKNGRQKPPAVVEIFADILP
jgi:hypothetical protein